MRKAIGQILILVVALSLCMGLLPYTGSAEDNEPDYDEVLADSILLFSGKPFYFVNGQKRLLRQEQEGYTLPVQEKTELAPVRLLEQWIPFRLDWDSRISSLVLTAGDTVVEYVENVPAMKVGGERKDIRQGMAVIGGEAHIPVRDTAEAFGYHVFSDGGLLILSETVEVDKIRDLNTIDRLADLAKEIVFADSFEEGVSGTNMYPGSTIARGWSFTNETGAEPNAVCGMTEDVAAAGARSMFVSPVASGLMGFLSPKLPIDQDALGYTVTFQAKCDDSYQGNKGGVTCIFYNGSTFVTSQGASVTVNAKTWTKTTVNIPREKITQTDMNQMVVRLHNTVGDNGGAPKGRIYFDDVKVEIIRKTPGYLYTDMICDNFSGMLKEGETAVFRAKQELPREVKRIRGDVFDSYGELLASVKVSASEFGQKGWSYQPEEAGFYEVRFEAETDKDIMPITSTLSLSGGRLALDDKRSFVVTKELKPVSERNNGLYFSYSYRDDNSLDALERAELAGFSGIRVHGFVWGQRFGNTQAPGLSIGPGKYDWTWADKVASRVRKLDLNVMANVFITPQWASSHPEMDGRMSWSTMMQYGTYVPKNMADWEQFLKDLHERYGDIIDIWEIWNEQNLPGKSIFWSDTPENYAKLLKSSYRTIKDFQPDAPVIIGGMASSYVPFYKELLRDPEIYDCFDYISLHGTKYNPKPFNDYAESLGLPPKPIMGTENYFMQVNTNTKLAADDSLERNLALEMMLNYFANTKYGYETNAHFEIDNTMEARQVLDLRDNGQSLGSGNASWGMFRTNPVIEPRLAVAAFSNYSNLIGKEFHYDSEFILEDSQRAVSFVNDGAPLVALWNPDSDFTIAPELSACFDASFRITDWEGRRVDKDDMLHAKTVYYIQGLDREKLAAIPKCEGDDVVNPKIVQQYVSKVEGKATATTVFDETTFAAADNVVWNTADWEYQKSVNVPQMNGFAAKYAATVNEKGFYLMVEVNDETPALANGENEDVKKLYAYDSIQFAVDAGGQAQSTGRVEFQAGLTANGPALYKEAAADIGEEIVPGWSKAGTTLDRKYIDVQVAEEKLVYKIFLPIQELHPYSYSPENKELRLSILVNDNDGAARLGYLEWSSGIGGTKDVTQYGKLVLP